MKNISLFFVFALFLCSLTFAQPTTTTNTTPPAQIKIGYVNIETVVQQLPEAIKANGTLEALAKQWKQEIDSLGQVLEQQYIEFQKQEQTMPEAKKKEITQNFYKQKQSLDNLQMKRFSQQQGEYFVKSDELMKPILQKVLQTIEVVAKEEGVQFVFDKRESAILLYADANFDLTFRVLDRLRRKN